MKQRYSIVIGAVLVAMLIFACGGGTAATQIAPAAEPATEASAVDAAVTEAPATEAAAQFTEYSDPDGVISVEVPSDWEAKTDKSDVILIDSFAPAEGGAAIQSIVYDDGKTRNQGVAGQETLGLLNQFYTDGAGDIKISKDEPLSDGSEQLTWTSKKGNFSGITVFKAIGKKIVVFSVLYNNDAKDYYSETLDYVLSTLQFAQ